MKLSVLFMINAVVAILFGLGFVLAPATVLSFYAVELPSAGLYIARLLGCAFIGFGIITWILRNEAEGSGAVRGVLLGLWVSELLGFVFSLYYQLQPVANNLGWLTVALYLLLGLGFLYFYFKKPAT
jgi:hypothetical protein